MTICPSDFCDKALTKLLKMSVVPLACQESQLSSKGGVRSETIDWIFDLKQHLPIWSRLNSHNTFSFQRKLPISMTKCYDIEIPGRLWSLWGTIKKNKLPLWYKKSKDKCYLSSIVMALCATRVFRLNIRTSQLLDSIACSGEHYLKESLKNYTAKSQGFQLEDLLCQCTLEGIEFKVCFKTVEEGRLYSAPLEDGPNLALALVNFLSKHQFGIVESFGRYLGFGFINGSDGGYFMFDAQSKNYPLFGKNQSAPYLLRTNHLQILLYYLVVSLNVPYRQAEFCIHNVDIDIANPVIPRVIRDPCKRRLKTKRILPKECWGKSQATSVEDFKILRSTTCGSDEPVCGKPVKQNLKSNFSHGPESSTKGLTASVDSGEKTTKKYQHIIPPLPEYKVEDFQIQPLVNIKEDFKEDKDFIKIVCSETVVPLTPAEKMARKDFSFVKLLPDALIWK